MVKIAGIIVIIGIILFLLDRLFLWFEGQGWMYYRHVKPEPGGPGPNILLSLGAMIDPRITHVITSKMEQKVERKQKIGESDPPEEDPGDGLEEAEKELDDPED